MSTEHPPKALLTDVFGTVVDWRTTVVNYLTVSAQKALQATTATSIPSTTRAAAVQVPWPEFAQRWRASYGRFTRSYDPDKGVPFKTVDQHHLDSLIELVQEYKVPGLWSDGQLEEISRIWHYLDPWPDSSRGLRILNEHGFVTATLSNGNTELLADLAEHGQLRYSQLLSAQDFEAYKPQARVYLGAAERLGLEPSQCALVAAHLGDLAAARRCGYQTIYIDRPREEEWEPGQVEAAKEWVDMWIAIDQGGFEELARRFGLEIDQLPS